MENIAMKNIALLFLGFSVLGLIIFGCCPNEPTPKPEHHYHVTLYSMNGQVAQEWNVTAHFYNRESNSVEFIDKDWVHPVLTVSGNYSIEEKD